LADEAAGAVTEPRRFHENEDERQQALSQRVAAARQALAKPCECEKPERCYDANCSMPNGHPGMHYDKRDGVAWGAE
jgi:hypothetical protein